MQKRIIIAVLMSLLAIISSLGVISYKNITDSIRRSLESRLSLAKIIGKNIDYLLEQNFTRLYDISSSGKIDFADNDWDPEKKALKAAYDYSIFSDGVFLLDKYGNVVLSYPYRNSPRTNLMSNPNVSNVIYQKIPIVSDVYTVEPVNRKVLYMLVPLKGKDGTIVGVAGGEINPTSYLFINMIKSIPTSDNTLVEIVDSYGVIIASRDPKRTLTGSDHNMFLRNLIAQKKSTVGTCHRCHDQESSAQNRTRDMIAFSPLSNAHWGIIVRDEENAVFEPARKLERDFIILSITAIITAVLLAIGMSKSIVNPIQQLISSAKKIGKGNLSDPVTVGAAGEIGILAKSFDDMRIKLDRSLKQIFDQNLELEYKITERTRELQKSRRRLSRLLDSLITAQEEERRRVARELHDDTSQSLAALGMSIDLAAMAMEEGGLTVEGLKNLKAKLREALDGVHRLIRDLRPPVLDDLGFESAIRWLLEKHLDEKNIHHELFVMAGFMEQYQSMGKSDTSLGKIELMLFRVVQESVINILKHASASNVYVYLCSGGSMINIAIEDDGKGFDPKAVLAVGEGEHERGFGILGMKERIAMLDGELSICSEPGEGTLVTIEVPIHTLEE